MDPRNAEAPGGNTSRGEDDICQEPTERALLRTLALIRGNQDTGYANSWLNVVPCSAHGTKMNKPTFAISLKWMMGDVICPEGQCPETSATNKRCPHRLDPFGDHAVCCATGPSRIARPRQRHLDGHPERGGIPCQGRSPPVPTHARGPPTRSFATGTKAPWQPMTGLYPTF